MDSVSSNTNTLVFSYPDILVETPNARKFETSISVSSLAEKFEKSGDFSKSEEESYMEDRFASEIERSHPFPENNLRNKSVSPEINCSPLQPTPKAKGEAISSFKEENCSSKNYKTNMSQSSVGENGKGIEVQSSILSSDPSVSVEEVKNTNDSNIFQPSTSAADVKNLYSIYQDGSELSTESQSTIAVEERVSFFVNEISKTYPTSVSGTMLAKDQTNTISGDVVKDSSSEPKQFIEGISKNVSLKDLEQSFIDALNMVNREDDLSKKTVDTLPVPSIQITEASDREDNSSDDDESKPKCEVAETKVKQSVEKLENVNEREINENKQIPSTGTASQSEVKDESEVSAEERKAFFYISSSDLPAEPTQDSVESCSAVGQSSENVEERADSTRTQESNETRTSCLRSKTCQGITFLVSFVLTIAGCMLYSLAHSGKAPDYCEYLGLIIAILAGIVGASSCICYSCLDVFSGPSRAGYEMIPETGYIPTLPQLPLQNETANAQNIDDSWSSEKEKDFRRQNGMSSTRTIVTSLVSEPGEYLVIKKSEHQKLVDKTEKLKTGIMELIDSFNDFMSKLEPIDELVEMESGMMNGF